MVPRNRSRNAVAAILLPHQAQEELELATVRLARRGGRLRHEQLAQLAQPREDLLDPRQQEDEVDADARLARAAAQRVHVLVALAEQHLEVPVVGRRRQGLGMVLDEATHLGHLGEERRLVARQRRQVLQQRGVGAERREPDGVEPHRLEGLVAALAPRRRKVVPVHADGVEQRGPVLARHGEHPAVILGVVEHLDDQVAQVLGVHRGRQQPPEQAPDQPAHEARVGQDAGLRIENAVHP